MTRQSESTELVSVDEIKNRDSNQSAAPQRRGRRVWEKIVAMRWRKMGIAFIIVVDAFLLNASISLIGVFFPTEVSKN